jgi:pantetheine-phosphate adenylyltransferase
MSKLIIYPGSFDPITIGHIDLAKRGAQLFDRLYLVVAGSSTKTSLFSMEERVELARKAMASVPNIEVHECRELIVKFAQQHKANAILRGVRGSTDFDYELQLAGMNRSMLHSLETLLLPPSLELAAISSSLIREIARLGGDVRPYVPAHVHAAIMKKTQ